MPGRRKDTAGGSGGDVGEVRSDGCQCFDEEDDLSEDEDDDYSNSDDSGYHTSRDFETFPIANLLRHLRLPKWATLPTKTQASILAEPWTS